jgi:hypothetical protein
MTSFVHVDHPVHHLGVARAEAAFAAAEELRTRVVSSRGGAAFVLAAIVSTLLVVADHYVDNWAGERLLAAWVVLWMVAFAALALFATPARRLAAQIGQGLDAWSLRIARNRADERLWATAQADPRVMADLKAAVSRCDVTAPRITAALGMAAAAPSHISLRDIVQGWHQEVQQARFGTVDRGAEAIEVPAATQTLLRADRASISLRDAAHAYGACRGYYY